MSPRLTRWCSFITLLLLGTIPSSPVRAKDAGVNTDLVKRALAAELADLQNTQDPMSYRLRKISPRLSTTKRICETKDGAVARLVAMNDKPLSAADEQKEQGRLDGLLSDPGKQKHRKQSEDDDTNHVLRLIRALPDAFQYEYAGTGEDGSHNKVEKFSFKPNPHFEPPDLETHAFTEMTGEIWVNAAQNRVARLEGRLGQDVDFGWGILGRLNKGGWIVIEQANVTSHQWRITHFQMSMTGRVLFKTKIFETQEDATDFVTVPVGLTYAQAIRMLRSDVVNATTPR